MTLEGTVGRSVGCCRAGKCCRFSILVDDAFGRGKQNPIYGNTFGGEKNCRHDRLHKRWQKIGKHITIRFMCNCAVDIFWQNIRNCLRDKYFVKRKKRQIDEGCQ